MLFISVDVAQLVEQSRKDVPPVQVRPSANLPQRPRGWHLGKTRARADVAQLAEQLPCKQQVEGRVPPSAPRRRGLRTVRDGVYLKE